MTALSSFTREKPRRALFRLTLLFGAVVGLSLVGFFLARSWSRAQIYRAVHALEKNALLAPTPVQRRELTMRIAGSDRTLWVPYVHMPSIAAPRRDRKPAPPIVFLPSPPGTLYQWSTVLLGSDTFDGLIEAGHPLWALEALGHGFGPDSEGASSLQAGAEYLLGCLRGLQLPPAVVVAHGLAGEMAWRAALLDPDRIAKLILIAPTGLPATVERTTAGWLGDLGYLTNSVGQVQRDLEAAVRQRPDDRALWDGWVAEAALARQNDDAWRTLRAQRLEAARGSRAGDLGKLRVPTLLLWGGLDPRAPVDPVAEAFAAAIPGAELRVLPRCGHLPQLENVPAVIDAITTFAADR